MKLQIYGLLAAIGIIPVIASLILKKVFTGEKTEKLSVFVNRLMCMSECFLKLGQVVYLFAIVFTSCMFRA